MLLLGHCHGCVWTCPSQVLSTAWLGLEAKASGEDLAPSPQRELPALQPRPGVTGATDANPQPGSPVPLSCPEATA